MSGYWLKVGHGRFLPHSLNNSLFINPIKASGYYIYAASFSMTKLRILPKQCIAYLCASCCSHNKLRKFQENRYNQFIFVSGLCHHAGYRHKDHTVIIFLVEWNSARKMRTVFCKYCIYKSIRCHNSGDHNIILLLVDNLKTFVLLNLYLIKVLPGNSSEDTVQHATIDETVSSLSSAPRPALVTGQWTHSLTCDTHFLCGLRYAIIERLCFLCVVRA
jgi:hypothetical protein